jgi:hypothetical protein
MTETKWERMKEDGRKRWKEERKEEKKEQIKKKRLESKEFQRTRGRLRSSELLYRKVWWRLATFWVIS